MKPPISILSFFLSSIFKGNCP